MAGSLVLNNVQLNNVPVAVGVVGGAVVLNGGTTTIASWGQGNVYHGTSGTGTFTQGNIPAPSKASNLLDSNGRIVGKTHPQYAAYSVSQFVSVRDNGAVGDGVTDDTAAIVNILNKVCPVCSVRQNVILMSLIVCWLQYHLLRCWGLCCDEYYHYSCRNTNSRRGVDGSRWQRFCIPESE